MSSEIQSLIERPVPDLSVKGKVLLACSDGATLCWVVCTPDDKLQLHCATGQDGNRITNDVEIPRDKSDWPQEIAICQSRISVRFNTGKIKFVLRDKGLVWDKTVTELKDKLVMGHVFLEDNKMVVACVKDGTSMLSLVSVGKTMSVGSFVAKIKGNSMNREIDGDIQSVALIKPEVEQVPAMIAAVCRNMVLFLIVDSKEKVFGDVTDGQLRVDGTAVLTNRVCENGDVLVAIAASTSLTVLKVSKDNVGIEKLCDMKTGLEQPKKVVFLWESVVMVVGGDDDALSYEVADIQSNDGNGQAIMKGKLKHSGVLVNHSNGLYVLGTYGKPIYVKMQGFSERIQAFCDTNNLQDGIAFCKQAKTQPCIGLPANEAQRQEVVDRNAKYLIFNHMRQIANDPAADQVKGKLQEMASWLDVEEWKASIYPLAVSVLRDDRIQPDVANVFFEYIYSQARTEEERLSDVFVELLLKHDTGDALDSLFHKILRKCRGKFALEAQFLDYVIRTQRTSYLAEFLKERPDAIDLLLSFYECQQEEDTRAQCWSFISQELAAVSDGGGHVDKLCKIVKWILAPDKNNNFPRIEAIIESCPSMMKAMEPAVKAAKVHIGDFVNILIRVLSHSCKEPSDLTNSHLAGTYDFVVDQMAASQPEFFLLESSIKFFLKLIFNKNTDEYPQDPHKREELLISVLNHWREPNEKLIPLCDKWKYFNANLVLQKKLRRFAEILKSQLSIPDVDIFNSMEQLLEDRGAKGAVRQFISDNTVILVQRDVSKLANIVVKYFIGRDNDKKRENLTTELLGAIGDPDTEFYFLHAIFTCMDKDKIPMSAIGFDICKVLDNYFEFLCNHYPRDVVPLLMKPEVRAKGSSWGKWMEKCKTLGITKGCAYIAAETRNTDICEYASVYTEDLLVDFIEGNIDRIDGELDFLLERLTSGTYFDKPGDVAVSIINAFLVPLFIIEDLKDKEESAARLDPIIDLLRNVCVYATSAITFDRLMKAIIESFAGLPLGLLRKILSSIINDYDYDIETKRSLLELFRTDEQKAQERAILRTTSGTVVYDTTCQICNKPLNVSSCQIRIFACGHAFHWKSPDSKESPSGVKGCLDRDECPVCHPKERIETQETKGLTQFNQGEVFRRLDDFESRMRPQTFRQEQAMPSEVAIEIPSSFQETVKLALSGGQ